MANGNIPIETGFPEPLGASLTEKGLNVAVASRHATRIHVALYDGDRETARFPLLGRSGDTHHGLITGVGPGANYGLYAEGPYDPEAGHLFDPAKLLIDPYARQLTKPFLWHEDLSRRFAPTGHLVPKCVAAVELPMAHTLPPKRPNFIYEIGVRAFTMRHPDVAPHLRGTVAALSEPAILRYLTDLGVDAVELMPLMAWIDERHLPPLGLRNAWGYNPVCFLAPDPRVAPGGHEEIARAVEALHAHDIRVILDVVFNHSGESDLAGPTLSLRGLDNATYYRLRDGHLANDTGCGNTLALDRELVVRLVLDAMRHWVKTTGIDGFRYDLASVLGRTDGGFDRDAPLFRAIDEDPLLAPLVHIAEPWDVGPGGYRLGEFPDLWLEWNDRYRDDVRRFWRGDAGAQGAFATRLAGSSDIFAVRQRRPSASVNFVAAHDGFTLRDVVSYERKDNTANGEENRDGNASEVSWIAKDPFTDALALLETLLVSRGTAMITGGDEFGRTQRGNNNAYAQDNEITWLDWATADETFRQSVKRAIRWRRQFDDYFSDCFLSGESNRVGPHRDVEWLGQDGRPLNEADWTRSGFAVLGMCLSSVRSEERLLVWFNRAQEPMEVVMPASTRGWAPADCVPTATSLSSPVILPARSVTPFIENRRSAGIRRLDDETISWLADKAGIQTEWWEVDGTHHKVSTDTKREILEAMGVPMSSKSDATQVLLPELERKSLPAVLVQVAGAAFSIEFPVGTRTVRKRRAFRVKAADGREMRLFTDKWQNSLELPGLPLGLFDLFDEDSPQEICRLLVSPGSCYLPDSVKSGARCFGLGAHLYALRHKEDWGIGDFRTLERFCEVSASLGASCSGINPLHHMFPADRKRISPYQPSDRRFIDPIYISLETIASDVGLEAVPKVVSESAQEAARLRQFSHVDYEGVWKLKQRALLEVFETYSRTHDTGDFERFVAGQGEMLERHAKFETRRSSAHPRFAMWLQWVANLQLATAARTAKEKGLELGIYRDLALGCAFDGGEVDSDPQLFASEASIGAPPDPFSRTGQVWNLPPYNPLVLRARQFKPFAEVLAANMRHAGMLRVDHVLGLARQFWIPRGAEGADGAYVTMDTGVLMAVLAIESYKASCMIVGEDLGTVPEGFREQLAAMNILSYRMLWFERDQERYFSPLSYPRLSASCLSSHDLPTFKGWRQSASQEDVAKLERTLSDHGYASGDLLVDAHAFVASSASAVMMIQADDLSGETEPLNVPGTDLESSNWRRRLAVDVEGLADLPATRHVVAAVRRARPRDRVERN